MTTQAARNFAFFRNDTEGQEVLFADARKLLLAWTPGEFHEAMREAEAAQRAGKWLAGYLSYEASYLLDPALVDACVAMFLPDMPERGRAGGLVGPAVPVGPDASAQDRLLGAMGRTP